MFKRILFSGVLATAITAGACLSEPIQGNLRTESTSMLQHYDQKIADFAKYFATTQAGKLLKEVVEDLSHYPEGMKNTHLNVMRQPVYSPYPGVQYQAPPGYGPLAGLTTASPQQGSALLTAFVSLLTLLAAVPFSLFAIFGGAKNLVVYTWCAIIGYIAATMTFAFLYGVAPNWIICILVIALGGLTAFFAYQRSGRELAFAMAFFACILAGNLVYDLLAGIPVESISPAFCGIAGLIFNTGFAGTMYYVMRLIYFAFVLIFAGLMYSFIPKYVTSTEPKTSDEHKFAALCSRYIICFICAWIVSGGVLQLFYLLGAAFNPLDLSSTFFLPTQIRWNTWESYFGVAVWFGLTYLFATLRERYEQDSRFDPELVSQEVKEQWKRATYQ